MKQVLLKLNEPNKNNRTYMAEAVAKAFDPDKTYYGMLGVPTSDMIDLGNVAFTVTELEIVDGKLIGKINISPTNSGDILKSLIDDVAFRPNGIGTLDENGVVKDYEIVSISCLHPDEAA